jgi:SNF2 family DNA or RNA helicase
MLFPEPTTFGAVQFVHGQTGPRGSLAGRWFVECEPHVRARLRRVFPRAPQWAGRRVMLSDTPENARELHWFLQRYPMQMAPADAARLEQQAATHVDQERRIAQLLAEAVPPTQLDMAKPPRDYQLLPSAMLAVRGGLLLADDVGVGKTVSAIVPMCQGMLPAVVVVPAHLPTHWVEKVADFVPALRTHVIRKGRPYPLVRKPGQRGAADLWETLPDVIVVSYHKLRGWSDTLAEVARYVVFEEAQQLRRSGTEIFDACRRLAAAVPYRLGLSATPIYNYGGEFFNVVDTLLPGALGERDEFTREWCTHTGADKARLQQPEDFGAYLRREGIMLRRTRRDVGRELPPVSLIPHQVDSDADVYQKLGGGAAALARVLLAEREDFAGQKMLAAGEFDAMVRMATGVAKAPYVADFVRMLVESGEKVLLFGWHREVYRIWQEKLADLEPVFYTGSESPAAKAQAKAAFVEGSARVLVMSLRSGAGVDGLQHVCRTVVFGELDWSPGVHEQCVGRIDRDGQADPVVAYYLNSVDGSDPIVIDVLGVKRSQSEGVRNPGGPLAERVDIGENALKRLAADYLRAKGEAVPASA